MKVFVTGASGFIGAHTALALLDAGHDVRLLVRNPEPVQAYFQLRGYALNDFVVADMRDTQTINAGLEACDAVFHAAALVSLDPRRADEIYRNNVDGIDAVLGSACRRGIDRIVYVSSLSVLFQDGLTQLNEDAPLGQPKEAYARSKRDCDAHVRAMQDAGMPIQMSYPSGVIGPDDPKLSEGNGAMLKFATGPIPLTSTGFQGIDVRDLARAHLHMLEHPGQHAGRYIVAGPYLSWAQLHRLSEQSLGRPIRALPVPGAVLRFLGHCADAVRRLRPFESQISAEAMKYATQWVTADSSRIVEAAGLAFRDSRQTFDDTFAWLIKAGHLPANGQ